jgi:nuclease-like protein
VIAYVGAISLPGLLLLTAIGLGFDARHWFGLARRSRVGAHSENEVRRVLAALETEGWRIRHGLWWRGGGDVDSVAIAPGGIGFGIETKTKSYDDRHLMRVREQAVWLSRRRRSWCWRGALPVLCVVGDRRVRRLEQGALVVSIDQLRSTLRGAAGGLGPPIGPG